MAPRNSLRRGLWFSPRLPESAARAACARVGKLALPFWRTAGRLNPSPSETIVADWRHASITPM
jgi:hypothetical protein